MFAWRKAQKTNKYKFFTNFIFTAHKNYDIMSCERYKNDKTESEKHENE